ncbi:DMT family transporter [Halorussus sp. MSC15.2]|uniref:DMT family transporter n=1 Tax=Halorussus sp. MSC15.2 TaxID=2283638 RepID=UPI0013D4E0B0|nr:DMT family transporter [Halorussus sp. MSC15.2]NEU56909.1 DMT family transporter [Halorussus sp. MSC15.2]
MDRVGTGLVLVSAAGFATLGVFGELAAAAGLSIPTVLTFRFLLATLVVWLLLGARGELRPLRGRPLAVGVLLGGVGYAAMSGLFFWGLTFMTAGLVGIVLYTYPVFVVGAAAVGLDEPVTRRTVTALVAALAGVALVTGADPAGADPRGVAVVLAAALVYAGYITASRSALATVDPQVLTAHVLPAAAISYLAFGTATGRLAVPATGYEWALVVAIAVVATAVPIFAFFAGLRRIGASEASIVSTAEPVLTLLLGAAVLGEPITPATVVGGALVLGGVLLVQTGAE